MTEEKKPCKTCKGVGTYFSLPCPSCDGEYMPRKKPEKDVECIYISGVTISKQAKERLQQFMSERMNDKSEMLLIELPAGSRVTFGTASQIITKMKVVEGGHPFKIVKAEHGPLCKPSCPECHGQGRVKADNPADHAGFDPDGADYQAYSRSGGMIKCQACDGTGLKR